MSISLNSNRGVKISPILKKPEKIYTYTGSAAVYVGALPNSSDSPVVVFVPGLGQNASFYWGENSMYEKAFASGYRTAFISFDIQDRKSQDMWSNGEMLARQLNDICAYYKTPRVIIVAHSKGGVDSQTAAVYFGAASLIERIITLSTPHWGSQLADLAYSSAGFELAELLKAHNPGCFSMQTGYMSQYRAMTDIRPQNTTPIFTFAGNGGDKEFTEMWASSLFLDRFGANDGVVTVENAFNPKGKHLGTLHLNHEQMGGGEFVWRYLEPAIAGRPEPEVVPAFAISYNAPPAHILKGGQLYKGVNESFNIDGTVDDLSISITIAGNKPPNNFTLTSPNGVKAPLTTIKATNGTSRLRFAVHKPQVGQWKLSSPPSRGAYCAVICLHSIYKSSYYPDSVVPDKIGANLKILHTFADGFDVVGQYSYKNGMFLPELPILENGIYSLEMNLSGLLYDGSTFERTLIRPFAHGKDLQELVKQTAKKITGEHK